MWGGIFGFGRSFETILERKLGLVSISRPEEKGQFKKGTWKRKNGKK